MNELFRRYRIRLIIEALLKSIICGFIIGFFASLIPAIITLIYNMNGLLYSLVVALGVGILGTIIFYFFVFRPTTKQIATRIDRIGLRERAVTMLELQKDESFMAMMQREDAKEKIKKANHKRLKLSVFMVPLIVLAVAFVSTVTMTAISASSVEPPKEYFSNKYIGQPSEEETFAFVTIRYIPMCPVEGMMEEIPGGSVDEYNIQVVEYDKDAKTVVATPWPGYAFVGWQTADNEILRTPERTDKKVRRDMTVYAMFLPLSVPDPNGTGGDSNGGGNQIASANTIIDGNVYYGDRFEDYYDSLKEYLTSSGQELTSEQRAAIELYFEALKNLK